LTSDRKIKANRANARASTGPQTARGRARAARNALFLPRLLRPNAPEISMETLTKFLTSTPQGPNKFATTILSQEAKRLLAMDRYERLALFRRKIAIQAFDEVRRRT
jgi:hypothetical protein